MQSDKRPSLPPSGTPASGRRRAGGWRPFPNRQLRTKLVLITLALLAAICLAVGLSAHAAMTSFLTGQLDEQLAQASARANRSQEEFRRDRDEDEENDGGARDSQNAASPLNGPGTRAGTLNARIGERGVRGAGIFTPDGGRQELSEADEQILAGLALDVPPVDRTLSVGDYRLMAHYNPRREYTIVTGLPLLAKEETLASLTRTMTVVSAAGLVAAALLGTLIIRRTLRPLEELSGVATRVSRLPLGEGEVAMAERVPAGIAVPATEVGRLGHAFNLMLDNVAGAFSARHRSETKLRQFVADASHELRTPLTAIRGYSEMIRLTENLSEEGRSSISRVESESKRMTVLVEDLLLLARMEEGHRAEQHDVDLTQLVVESVSDIRAAAPEHRWVLQLPDDPVTVRANPGQLRQVLINLLTNAHKHTGPGTTVVTSLAAEPDAAVLTVADDGPGIPADFIDKIFARFTRADTARSDRSGTHGLGLSIVDAIVESHGGSVDVSSSEGKTEFVVRLPGAGVQPAG